MSEYGDGGPAFPRQIDRNDAGEMFTGAEYGMTLRDYFAGQALAVVINTGFGKVNTSMQINDWCAMVAYEYADAMLKAREK